MKNKLKITRDVTPLEMDCGIGSCPTIYETNKNSYILIGKIVQPKQLGISNKVGNDEIAIEVPKRLIENKKKANN